MSSPGRSASSFGTSARPSSRPSFRSTKARSYADLASASSADVDEALSATSQDRPCRQIASVLRMLRSSSTISTRTAGINPGGAHPASIVMGRFVPASSPPLLHGSHEHRRAEADDPSGKHGRMEQRRQSAAQDQADPPHDEASD